ncbi:MAG: hypothetical protein HOF62_02755 [Gammaproteobacteria bacterium]|jgi:hypothetical protein|nr:hypothetical protein [Gammaproteobacteria bacterium]MDB4043797.1 hypothetical protein [Gammaproteobacteria bacterium]|tara:strand:+ start:961 stop:1113 length:153 start_codon:yes stop_codon:yes gene_type:complete
MPLLKWSSKQTLINELKKRGHIPPDTDASIKEILKFAESVGIKAELYTKK